MVQVHAGEPISKVVQAAGLHSGQSSRLPHLHGARPAQTRKRSRKPLRPQRRPECDSLVLRQFYEVQANGLHYHPLRSSTAEHPADNRKTVERHHAEGPFQGGATFQVASSKPEACPTIAGWLRQMSGGLKIRRGWCDTSSGGQFRGIDVTATCESSKLITSGQHRHAAPFSIPPWPTQKGACLVNRIM